MAMPSEKIKELIARAFPDAFIELKDLAGDDNHFAAIVKTKAFEGKTRIEQHQMVYKALQGHIGTTLHALSLKTQVPTE